MVIMMDLTSYLEKGTVWMGLFMAPGLPLVNVIKLILIMYIKVLRLEFCS